MSKYKKYEVDINLTEINDLDDFIKKLKKIKSETREFDRIKIRFVPGGSCAEGCCHYDPELRFIGSKKIL